MALHSVPVDLVGWSSENFGIWFVEGQSNYMLGTDQIIVFDRTMLRMRHDRAAAHFSSHRALLDETATQLTERLSDVKRNFSTILDLGAHDGSLAKQLGRHEDAFLVTSVLSTRMLTGVGNAVAADEEFLPFAAHSFDLIVSNLNLHWVNDLPGALLQIKNALRPGGLFLASLLGGATLQELRACMLEAEIAIMGGASPRLSPTISLQTASGLLQRAGFVLPVADQETMTFSYSDAFALMHDLRGMGETNTHLHRLKHVSRRQVFLEAARLYQSRFATSNNRIPATFDVIFLHGWRD